MLIIICVIGGILLELDICKLSPELIGDYMYFFDNAAFTDHKEWSQCYCIHFHWRKEWDDMPEKPSRDRVAEHIKEGAIRGYLAYADGKVVGWCNVNDKQNYAALEYNVDAGLWSEDKDIKVKSVVCFLVAPAMRGQGVATRLLERACADAEAEGYAFIEGYPPPGDCDMYAAHHGTVPFFTKYGFTIHKRSEKGCIMRKYFGVS